MKTKYFTDLGRIGKGRGVNRSPESAVKYTHDIFKRAAEDGLDVFMLTGSLAEELRDGLYKEITKRYFADSVREVLQKGHDVSIFIWDDARLSPHSPECHRLMEEARKNPAWGKLDIRSSGTREGGTRINHYIIAKNAAGTEWILRLEKPHEYPTLEQIRDKSFEVPAALFFDAEEAKKNGEPLLRIFDELCRGVNKYADFSGNLVRRFPANPEPVEREQVC